MECFRDVFRPLWETNPVLAVLQLLLPVLGAPTLAVYPLVGLACITAAALLLIAWSTPVWLTPQRH